MSGRRCKSDRSNQVKRVGAEVESKITATATCVCRERVVGTSGTFHFLAFRQLIYEKHKVCDFTRQAQNGSMRPCDHKNNQSK